MGLLLVKKNKDGQITRRYCLFNHGEYTVEETFTETEPALYIKEINNEWLYTKILSDKETQPDRRYFSHTQHEVMNSGRDILAEELRKCAFELDDLRGILPPYDDSAYIPLGFHTSARSVTVDRHGNIYTMSNSLYHNGRYEQPEYCIYAPAAFAPEGKLKPRQGYLNGYIPILYNIHAGHERTLESLYITEQSDFGTEPSLLIRHIIVDNKTGLILQEEYRNVSLYTQGNVGTISKDSFYDVLLSVLAYWRSFEQGMSQLSLPDKTLERGYIGAMMVTDSTLNGEAPVYGHRNYGTEGHSNFPPTWITAFLSYSMTGQRLRARSMLTHLLLHMVDQRGRIIYRQGHSQRLAASASEYGQIFWAIDRYEAVIGSFFWLEDYLPILYRMADYVLSSVRPSEYFPNRLVVHMCAEADSNDRVYEYVQNTLWTVRGLEGLCRLLNRYKADAAYYEKVCQTLLSDMREILCAAQVESRFGSLVPFQLGYTALPLTLGLCRDTHYPVSEKEWKRYISKTDGAHDRIDEVDIQDEQDLYENLYANYRYYPELLSSALLTKAQASAIVNMREALGGELLGMTRLWDGLDDWPAYHIAMHWIEAGYIQKFQMLLYAHTLYHGLPDFHIYYEQPTFDNGQMHVFRDSCIPSTLLTPLMVTQMFCYECVGREGLELLKAVPDSWMQKENFFAHGILCSYGWVSIDVYNDDTEMVIKVELTGERSFTIPIYLYINGTDMKGLETAARSNQGVTAAQGYLLLDGRQGRFQIQIPKKNGKEAGGRL